MKMEWKYCLKDLLQKRLGPLELDTSQPSLQSLPLDRRMGYNFCMQPIPSSTFFFSGQAFAHSTTSGRTLSFQQEEEDAEKEGKDAEQLSTASPVGAMDLGGCLQLMGLHDKIVNCFGLGDSHS